MTSDTLSAVAVEAALDHLAIQVPVYIGNHFEFAELLPGNLSTFALQGHTFKALSDAEAVGIVLMDALPSATCAELGLDCERMLRDSIRRELPVRISDGTEASAVWDLTDERLQEATPTYLVVFKGIQPGQLVTDDDQGDRVMLQARSVTEAIGLVLLRNPQLCYDQVLDHMEV